MSLYLTTKGGRLAWDLVLYLPRVDVPASDVVPGDIALSGQDTAYLVARVERDGDGVTLLDPLDNGEGGRPSRIVSIVRRGCLFGTAEQRLAHARGEAWLPHLARNGAT
mgnify:FL=1